VLLACAFFFFSLPNTIFCPNYIQNQSKVGLFSSLLMVLALWNEMAVNRQDVIH